MIFVLQCECTKVSFEDIFNSAFCLCNIGVVVGITESMLFGQYNLMLFYIDTLTLHVYTCQGVQNDNISLIWRTLHPI